MQLEKLQAGLTIFHRHEGVLCDFAKVDRFRTNSRQQIHSFDGPFRDPDGLRADAHQNLLAACQGLVRGSSPGQIKILEFEKVQSASRLLFKDLSGKEVGFSKKFGGESIGRLAVEFFRCSNLLDVAITKNRAPIRHGERFLLVMGDIDCGVAKVFDQGADFRPHFKAQARIQIGERFIKQHELRPDHQRTRQSHSLLLPPGELDWPPADIFTQMNQIESLLNPAETLF